MADAWRSVAPCSLATDWEALGSLVGLADWCFFVVVQDAPRKSRLTRVR